MTEYRVLGPAWTKWPLYVSVGLLTLIIGALIHEAMPLYLVLMVFVFAPLLQRHQVAIGRWLQSLPGPLLVKFLLLGYAGVIVEETIIGTVHMINEGFNVAEWHERIGQFIAFNLFAFTGLILGLFIIARRYRFHALDGWIIAGAWGLIGERTILAISANPVGSLLLLLPTMAIYSVIVTPALLSLPEEKRGRRDFRAPWRHFTAWALMLVMSIIPMIGLAVLRDQHPDAFPKCEYIPCLNEEAEDQPLMID